MATIYETIVKFFISMYQALLLRDQKKFRVVVDENTTSNLEEVFTPGIFTEGIDPQIKIPSPVGREVIVVPILTHKEFKEWSEVPPFLKKRGLRGAILLEIIEFARSFPEEGIGYSCASPEATQDGEIILYQNAPFFEIFWTGRKRKSLTLVQAEKMDKFFKENGYLFILGVKE